MLLHEIDGAGHRHSVSIWGEYGGMSCPVVVWGVEVGSVVRGIVHRRAVVDSSEPIFGPVFTRHVFHDLQ